jgi:putative membrane protein
VASWNEIHPAINACLNATSAIFLVAGRRAIRRGDRRTHKAFMLTAFASSVAFLISYVARFYISGTHVYPGGGWDKPVYLTILFTHMAAALVVVPLSLRALWLATHARFPNHKRVARVTWPLWMYTSVTGVLVYLMLYQLAPRLH